MHFETAILEIVHEKQIIFSYISRMYVCAQMSRELQTERSGMFLAMERKKKRRGRDGVGREGFKGGWDQNEPYIITFNFLPV